MTMTLEPTTNTRLDDAEYEAALKDLREYREQLEQANRQADIGSLERAAALEKIYRDMRWVNGLEAPKNQVWRGRPVDPTSRNRFSKWLLTVSDVRLAPSSTRELFRAYDFQQELLMAPSVIPEGVRSLRPLYRLERLGYAADAIQSVYAAAVKLAGGQAPTSVETKLAVKEFLAQFAPKELKAKADEARAEQTKAKIQERRLSDLRALLPKSTPDEIEAHLEEEHRLIRTWLDEIAGVAK